MRATALALCVALLWCLSQGCPLRGETVKPAQLPSLAKLDVECDACKLAIDLTRRFANENGTHKDVQVVATFFCEVLKIEDHNVCVQVIAEYRNLLFYVVVNEALTPAYACGVIDLCPKPVYPGWNVTFSKPAPPVRPFPTVDPKGARSYVLHFSDAHIDFDYTPGLEVNCKEPICCRPPNKVGEPGNSAGKWGAVQCDTPTWVYESMLDWISTNLPHLNYGVFTGDVPPHDVWSITRNESILAAEYVYSAFKRKLPNVPLFPAMGNHEGVPVNEFAPRDVGGQWNMSWLYGPTAKIWSLWLPEDAATQTAYAGFYTTLAPNGVRIISMNTNLGCNNENWFLLLPSPEASDPDRQLHWLETVLSKAEAANETVYIIKHIATSQSLCGFAWWNNYYNIIERYENIILADLAGHTHDDIYTVTYAISQNNTIRPMSNTYFPGSVTPFSPANPGFRVYEIDVKTKAIVDYHEYAYNLTQANIEGQPSWGLIYSARSEYSLPDMSPKSWHQLATRMATNETLATQYYLNTGKLYPRGECNADCLRGLRCDIINSPPGREIPCSP